MAATISDFIQGATQGRYLNTGTGQIPFTSAEFGMYCNLVKVLNNKENSLSLLWQLLQRSGVPVDGIEALLSMVREAEREKLASEKDGGGESPSASKLSLFMVLVLFKAIAHYQRLQLEPSRSDGIRVDKIFLSQLHDSGTEGTKACADLKMKHIQSDCTPLLRDAFETSVTGFELSAAGFESTHIRFRIVTTTTTTGRVDMLSSKDSPCSDAESLTYKSEVSRRFKDFEFLVRILHETAPGCVVPPLPCKSFELNSISETTALQRGHELTLFLGKITAHPVLSQSLTLKVFLEATTEGYKAWREICLPKPLVAATSDMLSKASAAAESGIKEMSRQLGSLFGMVGSKVMQAADEYKKGSSSSSDGGGSGIGSSSQSLPPPPQQDLSSPPGPDSGSVASASFLAALTSLPLRDREGPERLVVQLFDSLRAADACASLLDAETRRINSLSFLGGGCLGWSAEGGEPCLDVQLAAAGARMEQVATSQTALLDMQRQICSTPFGFLGRYCSSLQRAVETYATAKSIRDAATRDLLYAADALRRANEKYPVDSGPVFRAQEEHAVVERRAADAEQREQQALARLSHDRAELDALRVQSIQDIVVSLLEMRMAACKEQAEAWESLRSELLAAHFDPQELASTDITAGAAAAAAAPSSPKPPSRPPPSASASDEERDLQRAIQESLAHEAREKAQQEEEEKERSSLVVETFDPDNPLG